MKKIIIDGVNHRTITTDFSDESVCIVGDCSSSSLTSYWVVNRFNLGFPLSISITSERAKRSCDYYNKINSTDTFIVISRTIFV